MLEHVQFFPTRFGTLPTWLLVLTALVGSARAVDEGLATWPTYRHDNSRSGISSHTLKLPLSEVWRHAWRHRPAPAWPPPARQDFWHKKSRLRPRVTFDRTFHVVADRDHVLFGTSADDQLVCLASASGVVQWSFFAEAPIRLAPTISGDKALFGSDDGRVYCLAARDGSLTWSNTVAPDSNWIAGNGRIICSHPVRTDVMVQNDIAYCCAGIFPTQGVFHAAFSVQTGSRLGRQRVDASAQGYLTLEGDRLLTATGRDPAGSFLARVARRGQGTPSVARAAAEKYPSGWIRSGNQIFVGGPNRVAALDATTGAETWSAGVQGHAYGMAIAADRLYVSTDLGVIHAFAHAASATPLNPQAPPPGGSGQRTAQASEEAASITSGLRGQRGYGLVVHSGNGELLMQLARQTDLKWIGLETDAERVDAVRRLLARHGLYGKAVVHHWQRPEKLRYTDYLFNAVILEDRSRDAEAGKLSRPLHDELLRVLRPAGGKLWLSGPRGNHTVAEPLPDSGEWTHTYADAGNSACSSDLLVAGPLRLQWFGEPGPEPMIDRHHRTVPPLVRDGRMFVPADEQVIAVDAYNGTIHWRLEIPESRRVGVLRDCGSMAVGKDNLYVANRDRCLWIDVVTGKLRHTGPVPVSRDTSPSAATPDTAAYHWGYVATTGDLLIGSATQPHASLNAHQRTTIDNTYYDNRPMVTSRTVFAVDARTRQLRWSLPESPGDILNPSIAVSGSRMFLLRSLDVSAANGRVRLDAAFANGAELLALDVRSGEVLWSEFLDLSSVEHQIFTVARQDKVAIVGTRNDRNAQGKEVVWYDIHVFDAASGRPAWKISQENATAVGGSHGEQDHHPVLVGQTLIVEPAAYDFSSGERLTKWKWNRGHRRGCGTISASRNALFFRDHNAKMFDMRSQKHLPVTRVTRPGCWINMIPAAGMLLVPEASSGCSCNFPVQASMAFLPERNDPETKGAP